MLFDLEGWCSDFSGPRVTSTDQTVPGPDSQRVVNAGAWWDLEGCVFNKHPSNSFLGGL